MRTSRFHHGVERTYRSARFGLRTEFVDRHRERRWPAKKRCSSCRIFGRSSALLAASHHEEFRSRSKRLFKLRTFDSVIQRCAAHQLARQQGLLSTRDDNLRQCLGSATYAFNHGAVDVSRSDRFAGFARGAGAKLQCSSATRRTMRCGGRGCPTAYVRSFSRPKAASRPLARKFWASSFPKISIRPATIPVHPV